MVWCPNLVLFASTTDFCGGRPNTRYRAARGPLPCVPKAFQGSKCVRRELKRRKYVVRATYQVRANPLLDVYRGKWGRGCLRVGRGASTIQLVPRTRRKLTLNSLTPFYSFSFAQLSLVASRSQWAELNAAWLFFKFVNLIYLAM